MSGEHTGPSASPRPSPKTPGELSPRQSGRREGDHQIKSRTLESISTSQPNGESAQQLPLRSLGVHTILNPAEGQPALMRRLEEATSSPRALSATSNSSPRIVPPYAYQGPGMAGRGQTTPTIDDQPSTAPSSVERGSPSTARYPPIAAARRVLTPRSPRLAGPGQPHSYRTLNPPQSQQQQQQHLPTGSQDASRAMPSDAGILGRPEQAFSRGSPLGQQLSRVMSPVGRPSTNITPLPASTRSMSQPGPGNPNPSLQGRPFFPGAPNTQPGQPSGYAPHGQYSAVVIPQAHGGYPAPGGDPRWPGSPDHPVPYGTAGVRSFAFGEGQAALRIQPAHGEAFIVPVDTHQGSRQADEKRQRNAGASQRFRKRKKDRETQERMEHQRMESQYRDLETRIQTLENDRERLRSDRDRLRDIVYRTPTVDFSTSSYGSTPGSLPPISASGYATSISHPGTPSAISQAPQLPPLRLSSAAGTPTSAMSNASTPVQSYQQVKRESYETGWATGPRGSTDSSQR
ncbi:putative transcription factor bZIP [Rosellinia necatrix]|uniref:Putative transcription factor bZIP n=1 Tax=Rosellinia necatrix TaxID=77044 RepID=A0A1W2TRM4_ROSNE|nr:putative transcription factor bZIP [Rosellinia necatrix]